MVLWYISKALPKSFRYLNRKLLKLCLASIKMTSEVQICLCVAFHWLNIKLKEHVSLLDHWSRCIILILSCKFVRVHFTFATLHILDEQ